MPPKAPSKGPTKFPMSSIKLPVQPAGVAPAPTAPPPGPTSATDPPHVRTVSRLLTQLTQQIIFKSIDDNSFNYIDPVLNDLDIDSIHEKVCDALRELGCANLDTLSEELSTIRDQYDLTNETRREMVSMLSSYEYRFAQAEKESCAKDMEIIALKRELASAKTVFQGRVDTLKSKSEHVVLGVKAEKQVKQRKPPSVPKQVVVNCVNKALTAECTCKSETEKLNNILRDSIQKRAEDAAAHEKTVDEQKALVATLKDTLNTTENECIVLKERNVQLAGFIRKEGFNVPEYILHTHANGDDGVDDAPVGEDEEETDNASPQKTQQQTDRRRNAREAKRAKAERYRQARAREEESKRHDEFMDKTKSNVIADIAVPSKGLTTNISKFVRIYNNSPFLGRDFSHHYGKDVKRLAVGVMKFGFPATVIGRILGQSDTAVRNWQKDTSLSGPYEAEVTRPPSALILDTAEQIKAVISTFRQLYPEHGLTFRILVAELTKLSEANKSKMPSYSTIRRALLHLGAKAYVIRRELLLTAAQVDHRRIFCQYELSLLWAALQEQLNALIEEEDAAIEGKTEAEAKEIQLGFEERYEKIFYSYLRNLSWSDEKYFTSDFGQQWAYVLEGEAKPRIGHGGRFATKKMCWMLIHGEGVFGPYWVTDGTMNTAVYTEMLANYLPLEKDAAALLGRLRFQQDNASCHKLDLLQSALTRVGAAFAHYLRVHPPASPECSHTRDDFWPASTLAASAL